MKTINEAAKDFAKTRSCENEFQFILDTEAFKKGVEFAQRWIRVEDELPEQVEELISNKIKSENVLVKRKWDDGEIVIEINYRFCPSPQIGFVWNIEYNRSSIIEWRPIFRELIQNI